VGSAASSRARVIHFLEIMAPPVVAGRSLENPAMWLRIQD